MTYQAIPPTAIGAGSSLGYWLSDGLSKMGISAANAAYDYSEFLEFVGASSVYWTLGGAGAPSNITNQRGGVMQFNTAGSSDMIRLNTQSPLAQATAPFYFYTRFKLASAPTTTQFGRSGLVASAASGVGFYVGAFGPSYNNMDGTHYGATTYDGATTTGYLSTVTIDTAWHDFRIWSTGSVFKFCVDTETPITISGNLPSSSNYLFPYFGENGARSYQWDVFVAMSSRE